MREHGKVEALLSQRDDLVGHKPRDKLHTASRCHLNAFRCQRGIVAEGHEHPCVDHCPRRARVECEL